MCLFMFLMFSHFIFVLNLFEGRDWKGVKEGEETQHTNTFSAIYNQVATGTSAHLQQH